VISPAKAESPFVGTFGPAVYDFRRRTHIMGVLNVTPDSFSDGGHFLDVGTAVHRGREMIDEGADFIDIGGESSRPGSEPVGAEEETRRILPVIEQLAAGGSVPVSVDTCKSEVARRALDAGAVVVNDITGLRSDPAMADVIARHHATAVIMHMKGSPGTMQEDPRYADLVGEVREYLAEGIALALRSGIRQIIVDPGIGFGKTIAHNLEILRRLAEFRSLGYPLLVGPSRKSFIGRILDLGVEERLEGTAGAVAASIMNGASVVRVHDVKPMLRVARIVDAIVRG
jgi:dihydropteroate synthase